MAGRRASRLRLLAAALAALACAGLVGGQGDHRAWHELPGSGSMSPLVAPGPRYGQAAMTLSSEKFYWEFGGQDASGQLLGDLWAYDFTWDVWERRQQAGEMGVPGPSPRAYATLVQLSTKAFLYGGMCEPNPEPAGGRPCSDDLWVFDFLASQRPWSRIDYVVGGVKPPLRSGHTALTHGTSMFVYGGSAGTVYAREADRAAPYADVVWEYSFAGVKWVAHTPAPGGLTPLSAYGRAGTLISEGGRLTMVVHGGIHHCRGRCVTPSTATQLSIQSYTLSEMYWFSLDELTWSRYNLTTQPSKAFHALYSHREVDGRRTLFAYGGWGHQTTNTRLGEYQMQGQSSMQGDLWQLDLGGLSLASNWRGIIPASSTRPPPRMAAGSGYLGGAAPSFVVAGGLGCDNATVHDLAECGTVHQDLWVFDLWGWIAGKGTVVMEATQGGRPYTPDSLMLLEAETVAGERDSVSSANFREARTGDVTGLMWQYGMVLAMRTAELEPSETVTMQLVPAERVQHVFTLLRSDGASAIPSARVTLEVWDPMLNADFGGGWRSYQPLLAEGGELFTTPSGKVTISMHPTEWDGLPHHLASHYRLTCSVGTQQVYQDAGLKVYRGGVVQPVEMDLVSAGTRSIMFNARLPTTTLGPGQRGEAVRTGGQLRPYEFMYLDLYYDIVRPGQAAVVQVLSVDRSENVFAIFADDADSTPYPSPKHAFAFSACQDGRGTGRQVDEFTGVEYPMCRMQWTFPRATADVHMRVGITLAGSLGGGSGGEVSGYRVEVFYEDVSASGMAPPPPAAFTQEEVDEEKAGVDFVVLAVGLTLGIGACAGCWVLYRLASRRKRMRKFGKLRVRDMLLFNRPNVEIDKLVAHEMDAALRTAPRVKGQQEMIPIPQARSPADEDNPYSYLGKRGKMPLGLRATFGANTGETGGVAGFMGNLEAMAEEYRRGLLGGPTETATMSKGEAEASLAARYADLAAEREAAQAAGLTGQAVVMPKAPPRAPPGIAPPRPGSAPPTPAPVGDAHSHSQVAIELGATGNETRPVSASPDSRPGTPALGPRAITPAPPGIRPPSATPAPPGIRPPSATPAPPGIRPPSADSRPPSALPAPPSASPWLVPDLRHSPFARSPAATTPTADPPQPLRAQYASTVASTLSVTPPSATAIAPTSRRQPEPQSLSPTRVLAPPPPAGMAAAVWVPAPRELANSPPGLPNAIRSPPPPSSQGTGYAARLLPPPGVGPRVGRRTNALAPLPNREAMTEEERIAMRLRALGGAGAGGLDPTGRPANHRGSSGR